MAKAVGCYLEQYFSMQNNKSNFNLRAVIYVITQSQFIVQLKSNFLALWVSRLLRFSNCTKPHQNKEPSLAHSRPCSRPVNKSKVLIIIHVKSNNCTIDSSRSTKLR